MHVSAPQDLFVSVNICRICDADRDPLEVPSKGCGHPETEQTLVQVPVVARAQAEQQLEQTAQRLACYAKLHYHSDTKGLSPEQWTELAEAALGLREIPAGADLRP